MEETKQDELKSNNQEGDSRLYNPIGDIEVKKLDPKKVLVKTLAITTQKNKKDEVVGDIVLMECKHPDQDDTIPISKVLYLKDKSIKEAGLWYNQDKEDNIQKGSALAALMSYVGVKTLSEFVNKELETEANDAGYLCFKGY